MSKLFVFALLLIAVTAVSNSSQLPKKMPQNLVIYYDIVGGMLPRSESLKLSVHDSVYSLQRYGGIKNNTTELKFKMPAGEMQNLYDLIMNNDFDRIETTHADVYDRGGEKIRLEFDGKSFEIDNSGQSFIAKSSTTQWLNVRNAIKNILDREIEKNSFPITIELSPSIVSLSNLEISMDNRIRYQSYEGKKNTITFKILSGDYNIRITDNDTRLSLSTLVTISGPTAFIAEKSGTQFSIRLKK